MGPNECKYCGCREIRSETDSAIHFKCFSSYWHDGDEWNIATNCAAKCAVQLVESRQRVQQAVEDIELMKAREANFVTQLRSRLRTLNERIKRAVEVLEAGDRIMMVLDDDDEDVSFVVPATDVDRAVGILEGEEDDDSNSSKSSNSSPVTTDDLAASDYFEAIRQRVPWMIAVEHIEGLVEGYRRCGVMVWQTAEEIRKVHGGEHGKAN